MNIPLYSLALLLLSLSIGITMIVEGFVIVKLQKQIIPLPSKVLYWVGAGLVGKEKSAQRFAGKTTPENLRTYANFVVFFGSALIISSFIYLNWLLT